MDAPGAQPPPSRTAIRLYVAATGAGAGLMLALAWAVGGPPKSWSATLVLAGLAMLSWVIREKDVGSRVNFSFTSIVLLAAAAIVSPFAAGLVGFAATLLQRGGQSLISRVFNVSMVTVIGAVGGLTYRVTGAELDIGAGPVRILLHLGLALLVADVVQCLVNALLLAGVMQANGNAAFRPTLVRMLTTTGPAYVGYGIIGLLFVVLWVPAGVGSFSAVLILAPLLVAQWAFVQYGDEERAHQRTLAALVAAVETKDPGAVGHSTRVARLSEWTAQSLGLGPRDIEDARMAGELHDLGLLAVPTRVLRGPRPEAPDEVAELVTHPTSGVEMLAGIHFLRRALPAVGAHHERVDGLGYPSGLVGDAIPLGGRIVAVADAFDSLTTTRTYRGAVGTEAALSILRGRAGTHLDPDVVDALARAVRRHGWQPVEAPAPGAGRRAAWDHDDPDTSDLLAVRSETLDAAQGPAC